MEVFYRIIFTVILSSLFFSCSKNDEKIIEPEIIIRNPVVNQIIQLPETIEIDFSVTHNESIEYIRVSIVNKNLSPLSDVEYIYPEGTSYTGKLGLYLSNLPQVTIHPPYYILIAVSDFNNVHHYYHEIVIENGEVRLVGYAILEKKLTNNIDIKLFDDNFQSATTVHMDGNYNAVLSSSSTGTIYLATNTPELVSAIDFYNGEINWEKEPQLPYPGYNEFASENNILYISTEIGRIVGVTEEFGSQVFNTPVLHDTVPQNIVVTEDYIFADFTLRSSENKVWVSFYKGTGSRHMYYLNNLTTVDMFPVLNNKALIFTNNETSGEILIYNIESNNIEDNISTSGRWISNACKIDDNNYLFSDNKSIYTVNLESSSYQLYFSANDSIIDLKYEPVSKSVYMMTSNEVLKIHYPEFIFFESVYQSNNLVALELVYNN